MHTYANNVLQMDTTFHALKAADEHEKRNIELAPGDGR